MPDKDSLVLILEKIAEVSERSARIETKMEVVEREVSSIKEEDRRQNQLLEEHIQGTITNRNRLEIEIENRKDLAFKVNEQDQRLDSLEKFPNFLKSSQAIAVYIGAFSAVIYHVGKILRWW